MASIESCRFLRLGCTEDDHPLFRREYARNNRERGVKLLRCFPHCCPDHVKRSYCGCSVHVLVTFSTDVSATPLDNLLVCARFEPTRTTPLWPAGLIDVARHLGATEDEGSAQGGKCRFDIGERVKLPQTLLTTAERASDSGEVWVRAERESSANEQLFPQNTALYVLNNRVSPKWFYNYDSSVTRAQREMTHHLVAYVLQPLSVGAPLQEDNQVAGVPEQPNAVVVARHASPGFFLVSYRRSGGTACTLPAVDVSNMEERSTGISSALWVMQQQERHHHNQEPEYLLHQHHYHQQELREQEAHERFQSDHGRVRDLDDSSSYRDEGKYEYESNTAVHPPDVDGGVQSDSMWQFEADLREPSFREKFKHLFILWRFLQRVSLNDVGVRFQELDALTRLHWQRVVDALQEPLCNSYAKIESAAASFLDNVFSPGADRRAHPANATFTGREQTTIQVSVHSFLRALASCRAQYLLPFACHSIAEGTASQELQERFVSLILDVYDVFDDVLLEVCTGAAEHNSGTSNEYLSGSLPALVDDILSVVYGWTHFSVLRGEVSALLTSKSLSNALNQVFTLFVNEADECATAFASQRGPRQEYLAGVPSVGVLSRGWSRRWLLEPGSVNVTDAASRASINANNSSVSALSLALIAREIGGIDVEVVEGGVCYMSVRSALAYAGDLPTAPMELILDGRLRVFRILPSGISTTVAGFTGGVVLGDYKAELSESGQDIEICFFMFADASAGENDGRMAAVVHQACLSITLEQEVGADRFIAVRGTVLRSTYAVSEGNNVRRSRLNEMSTTDRGATWNELVWTRRFDFQADYVAI